MTASCVFSSLPTTLLCSSTPPSVLFLGAPQELATRHRDIDHLRLGAATQILFQPHPCAQEDSWNKKADPPKGKRSLLAPLSSTRTLSSRLYRPDLKHQLFLGLEPECFCIGAQATASPGALAHPRSTGDSSASMSVWTQSGIYVWAPLGSAITNPMPVRMWVWFPGWEDPLVKEMATHSSISAWGIPWTEEPGRLQSTGFQKRQTQLSD